jgi:tRNA U38,U39,U40 pseudouridine synthase TruA
MIGAGYWATGIIVRWGYCGTGFYGWSAQVAFYDG